jgi:hypothetical protein
MNMREYGTEALDAGELNEAPHHPLAFFTNIECRAWIGALLAFRARPVRFRSAVETGESAESFEEIVSAASRRAGEIPVATLAGTHLQREDATAAFARRRAANA